MCPELWAPRSVRLTSGSQLLPWESLPERSLQTWVDSWPAREAFALGLGEALGTAGGGRGRSGTQGVPGSRCILTLWVSLQNPDQCAL